MITRYLKINLIIIIIIQIFLNYSYALTGTEIINNANDYKNHSWICNSWNARPVNTVIKWNYDDPTGNGGRDIRYPFYPQGVEIGPDPDGEGPLAAPTATGQYTGIAYGWGLGDTIGKYDAKLGSRKPEFLVGNYTDEINIQMYVGVDCSGFLARCIGFPVLKVNPSHPTLGNYYILHPTTSDFMEEIFTDEIEWEEIKKGDILIRRYYEEDKNGDGRISSNEKHYGHIGIALGKPNGTTAGSEVEAIDASSNEVRHNGVKLPPIVATCTYKLVNPGDAVDEIHRSDGGKRYKARRLNPPYCKRVKIKKPVYSDDRSKIISYTTVYDCEWDDSKTPRERVLHVNNAIEAGESYIEIYFTKGMAVRTNKGESWENIEVICRNAEKGIKVRGIEDNSENRENFNDDGSNIKIFNGWCNGGAIGGGDGYAYVKWVGKLDTEGSEDFIGQFTINISAVSLMQDALDSNPATKAKRTDAGGWSKVKQLSIKNYQLSIDNERQKRKISCS